MKRLSFLLTALVFATGLHAQSYQSAIGARLGYPLAASYKMFVSEKSAIEVYGAYRWRNFIGYHWSALGVGATYQIHNDLSSVTDGLMWFYGFGADASFFTFSDPGFYGGKSSEVSLAVHGAVGLDYAFANTPVNLSLDWKPTFALTGYYSGFGARYGALAVRYILGR